MRDARLVCREHDRNAGVADFGEIGVLRHVLLFVGGDRPRAEVVDLFIYVVADVTDIACGPAASVCGLLRAPAR